MHAACTQDAPSSCGPSLGEPTGQRAVGYLAELQLSVVGAGWCSGQCVSYGPATTLDDAKGPDHICKRSDTARVLVSTAIWVVRIKAILFNSDVHVA